MAIFTFSFVVRYDNLFTRIQISVFWLPRFVRRFENIVYVHLRGLSRREKNAISVDFKIIQKIKSIEFQFEKKKSAIFSKGINLQDFHKGLPNIHALDRSYLKLFF